MTMMMIITVVTMLMTMTTTTNMMTVMTTTIIIIITVMVTILSASVTIMMTIVNERDECVLELFSGGCQHEITRPIGDIASPSWPDYYPKQTECVWNFNTTAGHRIKLVIS